MILVARYVVDPLDLAGDFENPASIIHGARFPLLPGLNMSFDSKSGGSIEVERIQPLLGRPFLRLHPVALGQARWLVLEAEIDEELLLNLDRISITFDGAALQSADVYALFRVKYADGSFADTSSTLIELRRERKLNVLPISLDDLPLDFRLRQFEAQLLLMIEARDIDVDFYGLEVHGMARALMDQSQALAQLRTRAAQGQTAVRHAYLEFSDSQRFATLDYHAKICDNFFVDVDPQSGEAVEVFRDRGKVRFEFPDSRVCGWRNFEFRFERVEKSEALTAFIRFVGLSEGDSVNVLSIYLRSYDWESGKWTDSRLAGVLVLPKRKDEFTVTCDLAPHLPDDRDLHNFGVLLFLSADCANVTVEVFEAFVFDRRLQVGVMP